MQVSDGCGPILAVKLSYAAPGGAYQGLHINHVSGCRNESLFFTCEVRTIVSDLNLRSFDSVETVCTGIMAARGCCIAGDTSSARCHVERTTTLGFYNRFHTPEGSSQSFAPSSSQAVSLDFHSTMASDPMVPSASWPSVDEDCSQDLMYVPSVVRLIIANGVFPHVLSDFPAVSGNCIATSDWTDLRTRTMHLLQEAFALRIGSIKCRPVPGLTPPFCALVLGTVLFPTPPFPLAAVPSFLCPRGTMSLLLTPQGTTWQHPTQG